MQFTDLASIRAARQAAQEAEAKRALPKEADRPASEVGTVVSHQEASHG